jgi:hypothetical protein
VNLFHPTRKILACLLASMMVVMSIFSASAQAALVSTHTVVSSEIQQLNRHQLTSLLAKEQAIATMAQLGVDPTMVEARVNNMTAEELQAFGQQVDEMQAGGSAVGVVVLVFVILIVLDLLGTTNIFPAIKPIQIN